MVLPSYQRKGIGTALMRHGFENRDMYQTLGFEDVDVVDVDFSEYMGKHKGYGVHRDICMIRQPHGVPSGRPKPDIEW